MKAEKKAAEKEAKVKEQVEQKESNDQGVQNALDDETLDPNVRFLYSYLSACLLNAFYFVIKQTKTATVFFPYNAAIL